jgi:hypothetical protein
MRFYDLLNYRQSNTGTRNMGGPLIGNTVELFKHTCLVLTRDSNTVIGNRD